MKTLPLDVTDLEKFYLSTGMVIQEEKLSCANPNRPTDSGKAHGDSRMEAPRILDEKLWGKGGGAKQQRYATHVARFGKKAEKRGGRAS